MKIGIRAIEALENDGKTWLQIADVAGVTPDSLRHWLSRNYVRVVSYLERGASGTGVADRILRDYDAGQKM